MGHETTTRDGVDAGVGPGGLQPGRQRLADVASAADQIVELNESKVALRAQGVSAICNDGTYSYSQHRSGTCSHHHGVQVWTGLI